MAGARLLATALVVLLVAPACGEQTEAESVEVPALGACRVLEPADVNKPTDSSDKVPCTEPHTAQTFAVGELPDHLADAAYDSKDVGAFAYRTCAGAFMRFLGGDESMALRTLLSWAWFRPTEGAWEDGARWYRCDVVGGDETSEELRELPETAKGLMLPQPPDEWMQCVKGESVPGAPRVPCTEPHDWRAVTTIKVGQPGDPYPGDRLVEVTTRDYCGDSVSAWLGYPPTYKFAYTWYHEAEWEAGNRRSVCWAWTRG